MSGANEHGESSYASSDFRVALDDGNLFNEQNLRSLEERQFYGRPNASTTSASLPQQEPQMKISRSITQADIASAENTGSGSRPSKLGTFEGVFIPTTLNVLSILMFLRFGFILGQAGILGILFLLVLSYLIDLLTTLSVSAISTNGTVRGGGAYYMISRSLGPEFGGSIGIVFYIGQVLNTGMNVVGFCQPIIQNFGRQSGEIWKLIPEGGVWVSIYSSSLLIIVTLGCMVGPSFFSKSSRVLFVTLIICTLSVPISAFFVGPYMDPRYDNAQYTGLSWTTFKNNFMPKFTSGAAGSEISGKENFQDMFGILFPATSGIFAGASMSGDLKRPSKSISKGTLWGLLLTFGLYLSVILAIGSTTSRELLYKDSGIIQHANMSSYVVLVGEMASSLFSALIGIIGASKLLQAISMDSILPGMGPLASETASHNPLAAIFVSYVLTQATLFFDINQIAVFITMAYLMTFTVTNMACFLLKLASAPNFRPSFRYFNSYTAGIGTVASVIAMFVADGVSASAMLVFLVALFGIIHYMSPSKPWGDVSQTLIYHQVRKYLLRLRQDHVKFWRPQILLLVDNPRTSWSLMQFCNHMKKGGLYILGHVIVTDDFYNQYAEVKKQREAWIGVRNVSNIKGFVQIAAGPNFVWGARNVYMGSGLGGMKPNITVLGFYEINHDRDAGNNAANQPLKQPDSMGSFTIDVETLPTDSCRQEPRITVQEWVNIIEDLMTMQANVAVAKGFPRVQLPTSYKADISEDKGFIDLYPIQVSAQIVDESGEMSALSTNFDTYMLILQLGAIVHTVPVWKKSHQLRVIVFVEFEEDIASETQRINKLLDLLRIKAIVKVICLYNEVEAYKTIVNGSPDESGNVAELLGEDDWWLELQQARKDWKNYSQNYSASNGDSAVRASSDLAKIISNKSPRRRHTMSELQQLGVSYSMQTNKLLNSEIKSAFGWREDDSSDDDDSDGNGNGSSHSEFEFEGAYHDDNNNREDFSTTSYSESPAPEVLVSEPTSPSKRMFVRRNSSSSMRRPVNMASNIKPTTVPTSPLIKPTTSRFLSATGSPADMTRAKKLKPNFSGQAFQGADLDTDLEVTSTDSLKGSRRARFAESVKDSTENTPLLSNLGDSKATNHPDDTEATNSSNSGFLSFNDLPALAQHVILNDMMKQVSSESSVLFSTLPAPTIGTHLSESDCLEYVRSLDIWCRGLPPIVLLNSQTMTVTTAL